MAKKQPAPTKVESLRHKDKRKNIPTEELRDLVADDEHAPKTMPYPRDPSLDPQLVWKGKDEQDRADLAVPVVPIYIQEKIHPQAIIDALPRPRGQGTNAKRDLQHFSCRQAGLTLLSVDANRSAPQLGRQQQRWPSTSNRPRGAAADPSKTGAGRNKGRGCFGKLEGCHLRLPFAFSEEPAVLKAALGLEFPWHRKKRQVKSPVHPSFRASLLVKGIARETGRHRKPDHQLALRRADAPFSIHR